MTRPVRMEQATVAYGDQPVLHELDLTLDSGDFVGLVGPNGSGKTTLLRTLLGLKRPRTGTVELFGQPAHRFDQHDRIGYVPQHAVEVDRAFPVTALEVVLMGRIGQRGLFRRLTSQDRARAREALALVGVEHLADQRIGTLSGGQRQRVFLAKALASDPELLILDEPTTGVDPAAREEFYNLIDGLNHDQGLTILLVSHDTQVITLCAHRVVVLNREIVFDGTPDRFQEAGGLDAFYDLHVHHDGEACSHD
ncbi:MAG: metal ABC transporter ATP-binding protein [Candidatus Thermoplasmatota archaeon]|nr:metal ABC transporter ATP-binding protein [Candidatus Thermoplasmatota archaeon]